MADHEYAVCIYSHVYNQTKEAAADDANARWILDAINNTLTTWKQGNGHDSNDGIYCQVKKNTRKSTTPFR